MASFNPLTPLIHHARTWWLQRHTPTNALLLTQRNIYILPTGAGLMFAVTLLVLLLASINYQLNLGYALTFLLAGSGVVSMHITHNTLRGLNLHLRPPAPVFAGSAAVLDITLNSTHPKRQRYGIGLRMAGAPNTAMVWCDVAAGATSAAQISSVAHTRGHHPLSALHIETRFPMGLFRAWSVWRVDEKIWVYPQPETPDPLMPSAHSFSGNSSVSQRTQGGETEGVRAYQRGDSLKRIVWKKSARQLQSGGDLVSRDTASTVQQELWLDWQHCAGLAPEERLSRLCAWVLQAHQRGAAHGLKLPGTQVTPAHGEAQRQKCLQALALWV
jgi:uncharacterized protein (DUF58 family)